MKVTLKFEEVHIEGSSIFGGLECFKSLTEEEALELFQLLKKYNFSIMPIVEHLEICY